MSEVIGNSLNVADINHIRVMARIKQVGIVCSEIVNDKKQRHEKNFDDSTICRACADGGSPGANS